MRYLISSAAMFLSLALPVQAMPVATVPGSLAATLVDDGCGPYGHRSHYGYCKDNAHPELRYEPGEDRGGGGFGYDAYRPRPRFYGEDGYQRRCFIRETYDGPVRICR